MRVDLFEMMGALGIVVVLLGGVAQLVGTPPIPLPPPRSPWGWGFFGLVIGGALIAPMILRRVCPFFVWRSREKKKRPQDHYWKLGWENLDGVGELVAYHGARRPGSSQGTLQAHPRP